MKSFNHFRYIRLGQSSQHFHFTHTSNFMHIGDHPTPMHDLKLCPYVPILQTEKILISGQAMFVVWQKSNETDFLLTMNFILFRNQGHPLQNSSLWHLHSD